MPSQQVTVATTVPLSLERAWDAYTDPNAVTQWNFANDQWHCPSASVDLRVGGTHKARMEAKDGSFGFDLEGTYTEVDKPNSLTLVLADGRKSRTTFEHSCNGTLVRTMFDAETEYPVEMQSEGWQAILNNYQKYVVRVSKF